MKRSRDVFRSTVARNSAGLAALALVLGALVMQLAFDWHEIAGAGRAEARVNLAALESLQRSSGPLRGAPDRLRKTDAEIRAFYSNRVPANYSEISTRIIQAGSTAGVQVSHLRYDQKARGVYLTEISIESEVSGTYPQIMAFVNGLERDRACFVIRAMTLTGQQAGAVNLQLRFSTWLRPQDAATHEIATAELAQFGAGSKRETF